MSSEVFQVIAQVKKPSKQLPLGQVALGFYVLDDGGVVTMTDRQGKPAEDMNGKKYSHPLEPNEDAAAIARKMTRELRLALQGNAPINDFDRPIKYPKMGKF